MASKYNAFISYNKSQDRLLAEALQGALRRLGAQRHRLRFRALEIFRDVTDFSGHDGIRRKIESGLDNSECLVLLANPIAARPSTVTDPNWVVKELNYWLRTKHEDVFDAKEQIKAHKIIICVTGGEIKWDEGRNDFDWTVTNCIPDLLKEKFAEMPQWVDLREVKANAAENPKTLSMDFPKFKGKVAEISAIIQGSTVDRLITRDRFIKRTVATLVVIMLSLLSTAFITAVVYANSARKNEALAIKNESIAREKTKAAEDSAIVAKNERQSARISELKAIAQKEAAETATQLAIKRQMEAREALQKEAAAKREANNQKLAADSQRREAVRQKEEVQQQLAMSYWNNSKIAQSAGEDLKALHLSAIAYNLHKSPEVRRSILLDALPMMPQVELQGIASYKSDNLIFSEDGNKVLTIRGNEAQLWDSFLVDKLVPAFKLSEGIQFSSFSHDARKVLIGGHGEAELWNADSGSRIWASGNMGHIDSAIFSSKDDSVFLMGMNYFGVFDVATGRELINYDRITSYSFTPYGKTILKQLSKKRGSKYRIINTATHQSIGKALNNKRYDSLIFSSDGNRLAIGVRKYVHPKKSRFNLEYALAGDGREEVRNDFTETKMEIWDVRSGTAIGLIEESKGLASKTFSPDFSYILTTSNDWPNRSAKLWSVRANHKTSFRDLNYEFNDAKFSADGNQLMLINGDVIYILDKSSYQSEFDFTPPTTIVSKHNAREAFFDEEKGMITVIGNDFSISHWDIKTGEQIGVSLKSAVSIKRIYQSPNKQRIYISDTLGNVRIWKLNMINHHQIADQFTQSAVISPNDSLLLLISKSYSKGKKTAMIWDIGRARFIGDTIWHMDDIEDACFSNDSKLIVTKGKDRLAKLWSAESGGIVGTAMVVDETCDYDDYCETVYNVQFSTDNLRILGSTGQTKQIWDVATCKQIADIDEEFCGQEGKQQIIHTDTGYFIINVQSGKIISKLSKLLSGKPEFTPKAKHVLNQTEDSLQLVNPETGVSRFVIPNQSFKEISYNVQEDRMITLDKANRLKFWDAKSGVEISPEIARLAHDVKTSSDGTKIILGGENYSATLWDMTSGHQVGSVMQHVGSIEKSVFSSDGKTVITVGEDDNVRVWDVESGKRLKGSMRARGAIRNLLLSKDGKLLLIYGDCFVQLWDVSLERQLSSTISTCYIKKCFFGNGDRNVIVVSDKGMFQYDIAAGINSPDGLFLQQLKLTTGSELNEETGELELLNQNQWQKLRRE